MAAGWWMVTPGHQVKNQEIKQLLKIESGDARGILNGKIEFQVIKITMKGFTREQNFAVLQKPKQLRTERFLKTAG